MAIDDSVSDAFAHIRESLILYILNNECEEECNNLDTMIVNDLKWNQLRMDVEKYAYELFDLISKKIKNKPKLPLFKRYRK